MGNSYLLAQAGKSNTGGSGSSSGDTLDLLGMFKQVFDYGQKFIVTIVILGSSYIIGKMLAAKVIRHIQKNRGDVIYQDLENLIRRSIVYGTVFTGFAVCLEFIFNIDFLQIVGFFGLGIGFAFRDLLANLIGGVVIILQDRFHVGDFISVDGKIKGKVMEIQTRATILKAIDGTEIIVPNADLLKKTVQSFTAHHTRRIGIPLEVHYKTNLKLASKLVEKIMKKKEKVLRKPAPQVIAKGFGESNIMLEARFNIDPQEHGKSWVIIKSEIIQEIQQAFQKHGILISYPQRIVSAPAEEEGMEWKTKKHNSKKPKKKHLEEPEHQSGTAPDKPLQPKLEELPPTESSLES